MDIETSNAIRLFFPNPSLELVYFEALANSLDAGATEISIHIDIQAYDRPETLKIIVTDNGSGFTDENFSRFKTLLKPRDGFHKGIGRLVFLKYFDHVEVESVWDNRERSFTFKEGFGGDAPVKELTEEKTELTKLTFEGFLGDRIKSYDDIKPLSLKESIIEHFLPTFCSLSQQDVEFKVSISLNAEEENRQKEFFSSDATITRDDLPEMTLVRIEDSLVDTLSSINMLYHIAQTSGRPSHLIAFSVDGRTIPVKLIQPAAIPVGYSVVFLFQSEMFTAASDSSRQRLVLPDGVSDYGLYSLLRRELGKVLAEKIPRIVEKNEEIKVQFEERYPHLLGYFEEEVVGLIDRDEALESAQQKFFGAQKEILQCDELDERNYEKSLELSSRALTEYILYRDKIIRRMKTMTEENSEAEIHNLIVPRFNEFSQSSICSDIYQNNAWLLDDKFMIFRTILSEARMDKVIKAIRLDKNEVEESGRPDIAMIFSADPEDTKSVDVVVVEIKKKTDDEKENQYAVNQLLDRAVKLAEYCPNIQRIWYYAVIQISDTMATRLQQQKWAPLFSQGRVFYQEFPTPRPSGNIVPTPTFIMSFDAIVADAECRNHAFLEILRAGMKKHMKSNAQLTSSDLER